MASKAEQRVFVKMIYPAAKKLYEEMPGESVHPIFETAQAALEKGWKTGDAAGYNMFGITRGSSWTGMVKLIQTKEIFSSPNVKFTPPEEVISIEPYGARYRYTVKRFFRQYRSVEECLHDHQALFRKPGYADAWPYRDDPREFARRLMDDTGWKYATGEGYTKLMHSLIAMVEKHVKELGL
jgi:flagellar protein FlgJ